MLRAQLVEQTVHWKSSRMSDMLFECSGLFKKRIFEKLQGDETLTGPGDCALPLNIEDAWNRVGVYSLICMHNKESLRLLSHLRKKLSYSGSLKSYEQKHPEKAKLQLGLQRVSKYCEVLAKPDLGFLVLFLEYLLSKIMKFFSWLI